MLARTLWPAIAVMTTICLDARAAEKVVRDVSLANRRGSVTLSGATGQIIGISDGQRAGVLASNEDRYDLDGKLSSESADVIVSKTVGTGRATFDCRNAALGLTLRKEYSLKGDVLEKTVRFETAAADRLLLKVSSQSVVAPSLLPDGHYYLPTDDGYKVFSAPFTPAANVKEPAPWTVSTGSFVFYSPRANRVFAHYRHQVNGRYFYSEAHPSIESKFIPGGAITALGAAFLDRDTPLTLTSRFALFDGDPREYHKHRLNEPPFREYAGRKVPSWFRKARMFLSDSGATGMSLVKNRELVGRDVTSFLKLLRDDEYLMVFFNHWTTSGDFPYQGTFRYYTYTEAGYSEPVPIETLKENIRWLKSLSPRIKVGGYALFVPAKSTPPYDQHPEWLVYDKNGIVEFSGDGIGISGMGDLSSGYREYLLDQMRHYVTDLGFDWIHMDCGPIEAVNWRTKQVVQSCESAQFYEELRKIFEPRDAALVENVAPMLPLWADGAYVECQQPDRWEKRDWRILAVAGDLGALWRTHRPGTWLNLCYGTKGIYGVRNAHSGQRGWIRNGLNWWRDVSHSLAHDRVIDELLETRASRARVSPSWWRLETDKLETIALERGSSVIVPLLWHGEQPGEQTITLSDLPRASGNRLFTFDYRLSRPEPLDVFRPAPWTQDYIELLRCDVRAAATGYTHRIQLEPLRNYYHVVTTVSAWVYSVDGERTPLLLPECMGVTIRCAKPNRWEVENRNKTAQVLAYVPEEWRAVGVKVNGNDVNAAELRVREMRCVLLVVPQGTSVAALYERRLDQRRAKPTDDGGHRPPLQPTPYTNPQSQVWIEASERLFYHNLEHRAYEESGMSCLALKEIQPGGGGAVEFHMTGKERAGGFSLKLKGTNSNALLTVVLNAGDTWTREIKDDFNGWKEFSVRWSEMTANTPKHKWDATTYLSLRLSPLAGREIHLADIHLLPACDGDLPTPKAVKRSLTVHKTKTPPVVDGFGNEACWQQCEVVTGFFQSGKDEPSDSKTLVRVCYDDENLYVLFDNLEPIAKLAEERVSELQVFTSDHAHLFLDPFRDMVHYYEIGIDTAGTVADIKNSETGWDVKWNGTYEVKTGLHWNVGWMAEMRIPFSTLGKKPSAGDTWGVTFARIDIAKEFSVWTTGEWNDPSAFGAMTFGGEAK